MELSIIGISVLTSSQFCESGMKQCGRVKVEAQRLASTISVWWMKACFCATMLSCLSWCCSARAFWFPGHCCRYSFTTFLTTFQRDQHKSADEICGWNLSVSPAPRQLSQPRFGPPNGSNLHVSLGLLESQYVLLENSHAILDVHHWWIYITYRTFPISLQHQKCIDVKTVELRSDLSIGW